MDRLFDTLSVGLRLILLSLVFLISPGCCVWQCLESSDNTPDSMPTVLTIKSKKQIVPKPDVRLALDIKPVEKGIKLLDNLKYSGKMDGGYCKLVNIDVWSFGHNKISLDNWYDGIKNTYGTYIRHGFKAKGSVNTQRCGDWSKEATANIETKLGSIDLDQDLSLHGKIFLNLSKKNERNQIDKLSFSYTHDFNFKIPKPIDMRNEITIKVGKKELSSKESIEFTFGRFSEEQWIPTGNKVDIPIALNFFSVEQNGRSILLLDGAIGESIPFHVIDADEVVEHKGIPVWGDNTVGIGLGSTLFGHYRPGKSKKGILGYILPLKISGNKILSEKLEIKYEIYIDGGEVQIDKETNSIQIKLATTKAKITEIHNDIAIGTGCLLKQVEGKIVLGNAKLIENNDISELAVPVKNLSIEFSTCLGNVEHNVKIDNLGDLINNGNIIIGSISEMFKNLAFEIPLKACIYVPDTRIWSWGKCPGIPCPANVHMSKTVFVEHGQVKINPNPRWELNLAGAESKIENDFLLFGVPMIHRPKSSIYHGPCKID
jgi:hypothetical protein